MSTQTDLRSFLPVYTPGPVFYSPELESWQVPNYADAVAALRLQSTVPVLAGREGTYQVTLPAGPMGSGMWARDEPAHAELRALTEARFRPEAIAPIIAATRQLAHALLEGSIQQHPVGRIELVDEYVSPLADEAICLGLVGIDPVQEGWLRAWMHAWQERNTTEAPVFARAEASFVAAFRVWVEQREAHPGHALIDRLIDLYLRGAPVCGSPMSFDELAAYFDMLAVGAYESLRTNIATALLTLIEADALAELRARREQETFPALLASAREEALRLAPSFPCVYLITRAEVTLGGQAIPAGVTLMIWLSAANRDPAVYTDPDRFDLWRYSDLHQAPKPPLTFSYGMHYCLGALLSRQVIEAAFEAFVDHVPLPVRLDPGRPATYYPFYGLDHTIVQASLLYGKDLP